MKKAEIIFAICCLVGFLLRLQAWPASGAILIIGTSSLACLYMYLSFALFNGVRLRHLLKKDPYEKIPTKNIIMVISVGFMLSISLIAILFETMKWPGAKVMLSVGALGLIVIAIVGSYRYFTKPNETVKRAMIRVLVVGVFTVGLWINKKNVSLSIEQVEDSVAVLTLWNNEGKSLKSMTIEYTFLANSDEVINVDTVTYLFNGIDHAIVEAHSESSIEVKVDEECQFVYGTILDVKLEN